MDFLVPSLIKAGIWIVWITRGERTTGMSVCKEWRDAIRGSSINLAAFLVEVYGSTQALMNAAACTSNEVDSCALVRQLLLTADVYSTEAALLAAARKGNKEVVRLLLTSPQNAPQADCNEGEALVQAASNDH
jgi:hypothetical protein